MRISDWSSDVCSSDLSLQGVAAQRAHHLASWRAFAAGRFRVGCVVGAHPDFPRHRDDESRRGAIHCAPRPGCDEPGRDESRPYGRDWSMTADRSEEHTSELQSLMRISYAVFCLKKKNN